MEVREQATSLVVSVKIEIYSSLSTLSRTPPSSPMVTWVTVRTGGLVQGVLTRLSVCKGSLRIIASV